MGWHDACRLDLGVAHMSSPPSMVPVAHRCAEQARVFYPLLSSVHLHQRVLHSDWLSVFLTSTYFFRRFISGDCP